MQLYCYYLVVINYWFWLNFDTFICFCSRNIQLSLAILLLGVGIATVTDLQLNLLGSVLSLLAVITTCVAQIVSLAGVIFAISFRVYFCHLFLCLGTTIELLVCAVGRGFSCSIEILLVV